ncbi:hypothetical protein V8E54_008482 [Elaphomyces granulatus]
MDSLLAFHSNNFPSEVSAAVILFLHETLLFAIRGVFNETLLCPFKPMPIHVVLHLRFSLGPVPEDASPWVYAGNILEEQKAELPADCYAAPGPVPESNNNNKQPHSNPLLAGPLTKSQMQDNARV